jgi:hypothetical protein
MTFSEDHWHQASDTMLPRAVCYADTGCSAGVVADHQVFLSAPVTPTNGAIPVFSVHQLADNSWVGTLGILGSTRNTTIRMEKNNVDPSQPINFTINSANLGAAGSNMFVTAQANLTNQSSVLHYTITGTASIPIPEINITPKIWKKTDAGDVLVYTGEKVTCSAATTCIAAGNFTSNATATYYANATVLYTVPTTVNGVAGTRDYATLTASDLKPCSISCSGPPTGDYFTFTINSVKLDGKSEWQGAVCYDNALIRWGKAGRVGSFKSQLTPNRWRENSDCKTDYSFAVDSPANKPIYMAAVVQQDSDIGWYHAVNAELIDTSKDPTKAAWQDWKFFQYTETDIKIGYLKKYSQIPNGTSNFKTSVQIGNITSITSGQYVAGTVERTFYINRTGNVSLDKEDPPRMKDDVINQGYVINQAGKALIKNQDVSDELKKIVQSIGRNGQFTLNKWEFNPISNEVMFYVFDIKDESTMNDLQVKQVGNYTIRVSHDSEFEATREDVARQLGQFSKDPAYQIADVVMTTDRVDDPPGNYAELWVYKSTPENRELDNRVINGWTIRVYPVSL